MIYVVGIGPGERAGRTGGAEQALRQSDVIVGYTAYVDLIRSDFPDKPLLHTGMRAEVDRCARTLALSREGKTVSLICSGDAGLYGMASLLIELSDENDEIEIVPGVTAALSAAAILGAPISCDFAAISLSDLLTPWPVIERRLSGAALGDFVIALYNPASRTRTQHLRRACDLLLPHRSPDTACGWVKNIGREGQVSRQLTLIKLREETVDMFTIVLIGNSQTLFHAGRMLTPRGYRL